MLRHDRPGRDSLVDELKQKIRKEKLMLEGHIVPDSDDDAPEVEDRPYRAKKLSEVFKSMGFEG